MVIVVFPLDTYWVSTVYQKKRQIALSPAFQKFIVREARQTNKLHDYNVVWRIE